MASAVHEQYVTQQGDMIDLIASERFGDALAAEMTVSIYGANPGLAEHGPVLPEGLTILIPVPEATSTDRTQSTRLWS